MVYQADPKIPASPVQKSEVADKLGKMVQTIQIFFRRESSFPNDKNFMVEQIQFGTEIVRQKPSPPSNPKG